MTESDPKLPGKERRYLTVFLKFLFFVIALVAVMLTVLFNMGGSSEVLKSSLEKFLSDSLGGRPTTIAKLHRISFFPVVGVDFNDLKVRETQATEELSLSVKNFKAFVTFWGMIVKKTEITALYMEDLNLRGGFVGKRDFSVEKLFIDHDKGTKKAEIRAKGLLDNLPWNFSLGMDVSGSIGGYKYSFGKNRPVVFNLDKLNLAADISEQINDYIKIESLSMGDEESRVTGNLSLSLLEGQQVKINGRLASGDQKNIMKPDLILDYSVKPIKFSGELLFPQTDQDSLKGEKGPLALLDKLHEIAVFQPAPPQTEKDDKKTSEEEKPRKKVYLCGYDFDLKISSEGPPDAQSPQQEAAEFMAKNSGNLLKITPIKGKVVAYEGPCDSHPFF